MLERCLEWGCSRRMGGGFESPGFFFYYSSCSCFCFVSTSYFQKPGLFLDSVFRRGINTFLCGHSNHKPTTLALSSPRTALTIRSFCLRCTSPPRCPVKSYASFPLLLSDTSCIRSTSTSPGEVTHSCIVNILNFSHNYRLGQV